MILLHAFLFNFLSVLQMRTLPSLTCVDQFVATMIDSSLTSLAICMNLVIDLVLSLRVPTTCRGMYEVFDFQIYDPVNSVKVMSSRLNICLIRRFTAVSTVLRSC